MLRTTIVRATLLTLTSLTLQTSAHAQGTREDYERARRFLPDSLDGLVLNPQINVSCIGESDRVAAARRHSITRVWLPH
jgi:hypothetical protein